jgi:small subunit ribosomal protein S1
MAPEEKPENNHPEFQNSETDKEGGEPLQTPDQPEETTEQESTASPQEEASPQSGKETALTGDQEKPQAEEPETEKPKPSQVPAEKLLKIRVSPEGDKVVGRDQLPSESEYEPEEIEDFSELYEKTLTEIKEGEIVTGKIVAISDKDIAVDIGFKSEGTVPVEEFTDPEELKIGAEIEVYLDRVENQEGQLILSKKKADFMKVWARIKEIHENSETVEGKIIRRIKGGMVVDLMGVDAFLPGSQIDVHPVRDFDALVGKIMDFRIVKINDTRKNIVLSHKILVEESLAEIREKILSDMKVGNILDGVVKNITDFGVFVDLGGVDGLLHITDLSWGRVSHPSEIVNLDQKIRVKVLDYDQERQRISLGLKQLMPHPWEGVEERYPVGSKITGKVVSIARYGAFVELEKGVEGLVHISEMSWTQNIKHPSMVVSVGDEVEVVVLGVDVENRKISLGMKQCEPDPWESLEEKYRAGTTHKGIVRDLVPFGAFVELEEGIEGLVHISDLSWTRKVRHPGEIVKKGEEVDVQILGFDRNERRISLGYKQTQENPWDRLEQELTIRTPVRAKVVRILEKGVVVMLPQDVEGFVPNSHLRRYEKGAEKRVLNVDDDLNLVVIEFDKDAKKIILSAYEAEKSVEDEEYQEYLKKQAKEAEVVETKKEEPEKAEAVESPTAEVKKEKAEQEAPAEEPKEEPAPTKPTEEKAGAEPDKAEAIETPVVPEEKPPPPEPVEEKAEDEQPKEAPEAEKEAIAEPEKPAEEEPSEEPKAKSAPAEPTQEQELEKPKPKKAAKKKATKRTTKKASTKKAKTKPDASKLDKPQDVESAESPEETPENKPKDNTE